jgi:serine/threonine protein kinase HipA of HipAB toxin-antitoxin module
VSGATHADPRGHAPAQALRDLGVRCAVEARGTLAVVIPAVGERALEDTATRRAVLAALRAHGFTHVAVEPADDEPATTQDARIV